MEFAKRILQAEQNAVPHVLATIVETCGACPRKAGSRMLVYADGSVFGSIGGGKAERDAVQDALEIMDTGQPVLKVYGIQSSEDAAMQCASRITVFLQPAEKRPRLVVVGGGHVGKAVLQFGQMMGFETLLLDDRTEAFLEDAKAYAHRFILVQDYYQDIAMLSLDKSYCVLCAWGHQQDMDALRGVLEQTPAYIGMLGGKHKIHSIFETLKDAGVSEQALRQVHTPCGLDLGGQTPNEVALSVIAQVQAIRYARPGGFLKG